MSPEISGAPSRFSIAPNTLLSAGRRRMRGASTSRAVKVRLIASKLMSGREFFGDSR